MARATRNASGVGHTTSAHVPSAHPRGARGAHRTMCAAMGLLLCSVVGGASRMAKSGAAGCTVSLTQQISSTKCIFNTNFGCNTANKTMWIKGGCRGKFSCDGQQMECWSVDKQTTRECPCKEGPFHPPHPAPPSPGPPAPGPHPRVPKTPFVPMHVPNMNGMYFRSETGTHAGARQPVKQFKDYPGGARYFDVYTPVFSTLYSQVWWAALPPVDLSQDVIDRYADGGVMAMIGIECDQVRRIDGRDISVPINAAYNHHFTATLAGAKTSLEKLVFTGADDPRRAEFDTGHGVPDAVYRARELATGVGGVSTHLGLGGGNGGEYRKTYHGFPEPYARLIESPRQFQFTPMQIDTWNRDEMNISVDSPPFISGPQPRNSLAVHKDAAYSGLLECPFTTRLSRMWQDSHSVQLEGTCEYPVENAAACFAGAAAAIGQGVLLTNSSGSNASMPSGCSATASGDKIHVFWNEVASAARCGGESGLGTAGIAPLLERATLKVRLDGALATIAMTGNASNWFGVGFGASAMKQQPWALIVEGGTGAVSERKLADQSPGTLLPKSVTVHSNTVVDGLRTVVLSRPLHGATFSFNATSASLDYITAIGSGPKLAYHKNKMPGRITFLPLTEAGGGACICAGRPAPFGSPIGGKFLYTPTTQKGEQGSGEVAFENWCAPEPRTDLLAQRNPTCDVRAYTGGQTACHHLWSLLDADQEIPWPDQPLEYQIKFRFWYQDYNASYHRDVRYSGGTTNWDVGAGGGPGRPAGAEYDVPLCNSTSQPGCKFEDYYGNAVPEGTRNGTWVHYLEGTFYIGEDSKHAPADFTPVVAHMHVSINTTRVLLKTASRFCCLTEWWVPCAVPCANLPKYGGKLI